MADQEGVTNVDLLYRAVERNDTSSVRRLLELGVNPNPERYEGSLHTFFVAPAAPSGLGLMLPD